MIPSARFRARRGMTIVELLAALSIVALLVAGVAGGLRVGRQTWRLAEANERRAELEAAARALRAMLSRTVSVAALSRDNRPELVFDGTPDALTFVHLADGGAQWAGLIHSRIALDPARPGHLAIWTAVYRPRTALRLAPVDMQRSDVVDGTTALRLRYFGRFADEETAEWRDTWTGGRRLPELVAFRIDRLEGKRSVTVEDTVAVGAD